MLANRPLTILLLAATFSLDVAVFAAFSAADVWVGQIFRSALFLSQFGLLSVWLAMGKAPWTIRFAAWGLAAPISLLLADRQVEQATNFVIVIAYGTVVALATTWLQRFLPEQAGDSGQETTQPAWQFSLRHLLVWTTVIAVTAAAARFSDLPVLIGAMLVAQVASFILVPLLGLLLLFRRDNLGLRFAALLAVCLVLGTGVALASRDDPFPEYTVGILLFYVIHGLVTGIWLLVASHETIPTAPGRPAAK